MATLAIQPGAIFDGVSDKPSVGKSVIVHDGLIEEIREGAKADEILEFPDCMLLPGLIDAHLHFGIEPARLEMGLLKDLPAKQAIQCVVDAWRTLSAGFTTVRLMGTTKGFADIALRDLISQGIVNGPRILACGQMISMTGGHAEVSVPAPEHIVEQWATIVDGEDEARKGARSLLRRDVDFLKVIASGGMSSPADEVTSRQLSAGEIRAICEEAKAAGRYVSAHAQGIGGIRCALDGGVASIEHGFFLDREGARFMRSNDVFLVPTLSVPEVFYAKGKAGTLPEFMFRKSKIAREASRKAFRVAMEEGVPIVAGSDNGFPDLHGKNAMELELMVENGMPVIDVLRSATSVAANYIGLGEKIGQIAPGFVADLVAVEGDPLEDISATRQVRAVFKSGEMPEAVIPRLK